MKKNPPTIPMFPGDMPSYSPPARSLNTPPLPPGYQSPFADKPTLRGTNSDSILYSSGGPGPVGGGGPGSGGNVGSGLGTGPIGLGGLGGGAGGGGLNLGGPGGSPIGLGGPGGSNRRPIPPPSLTPGQERIPFRPPDLVVNSNGGRPPSSAAAGGAGPASSASAAAADRKKVLNTPFHVQKTGGGSKADAAQLPDDHHQPSGAAAAAAANAAVLHFPSISRILSGSNGRKEDIPEVLLRTVTAKPPSAAIGGESGQRVQPNLSGESSLDGGGGDSMGRDDEDDDGGDADDSAAADERRLEDRARLAQEDGGGGVGLDGVGGDGDRDGADEDDDDDGGMMAPNDEDFITYRGEGDAGDGETANGRGGPKSRPNVAANKSTQSPLLQSDVYSTQIVHSTG